MSYLAVERLAHAYGSTRVLHDISFEVGQGERLCLLGPSGCGKTTTLQILAGFVQQADGTVKIDGEPIDRLPPEKRNVGIMFQNYALFPHMTVFDNVGYGLKMRKVPRDDIRKRVTDALQLVKLAHAAAKLPSQLSGGEQQRIAFARAIVIRPRLLLLDEPFSNLDARLRVEMRGELLSLLETLDIATLMVTHDQEEAMAIADRIAVMQGGRIEQIGSTHEIYEKPSSVFVGRFIGESNTFPAHVVGGEGGRTAFEVEGLGRFHAPAVAGAGGTGELHALMRPERVTLHAGPPEGEGWNTVQGTVETAIFLGHRAEIRVRCGSYIFLVWEGPSVGSDRFAHGDAVTVAWREEDTFLVPETLARVA